MYNIAYKERQCNGNKIIKKNENDDTRYKGVKEFVIIKKKEEKKWKKETKEGTCSIIL